MRRLLVMAWLVAMSAVGLAGCAGPYGSPGGRAVAPYDIEGNPYCGVYGDCQAYPPGPFQPYEFQEGG